jgi:glycosyltransferase involved in cell wall biosynthesis
MTGTSSRTSTILVDCRWSGRAGVGRVTDSLLKAWSERPPEGQWILWGPESVSEFLWPGAVHIRAEPPGKLAVQHLYFRRLPKHDLALFLHQIHPLTAKRYVTIMHDTIPLRWGGGLLSRLAKRAYLAAVATRAEHLITVSDFSSYCIQSDFGVAEQKVTVLPPPQDRAWEQRVRKLRAITQTLPMALYVGRYARHKNLERLIRVFPRTDFARRGGQLQLVGGEPSQRDATRTLVEQLGATASVTVAGRVSDEELDRLYATAQMLILPSYEEGYGLPAYEALNFGLPVCSSTGGALADVAPYAAATFDPHSDAGLQRAIDDAATAPQATQILGRGADLEAYGSAISALVLSLAARTR